MLIKCKECGREISDLSEKCVHCGCIVQKKNIISNKNKGNEKRIVVIIGIVVIALMGIIGIRTLLKSPIEKEASKYIREVKKIDEVESINGVVGIAKKEDDEEKITYGYVIFYSTKTDSEIAYFINDVYMGDGNNGGDATSSENELFYNLGASLAIVESIEFMDEEGLIYTKCKEKYEVEEGIAYINLIDMETWFDNY